MLTICASIVSLTQSNRVYLFTLNLLAWRPMLPEISMQKTTEISFAVGVVASAAPTVGVYWVDLGV